MLYRPVEVGDHAIDETETVLRVGAIGPLCKAEALQCRIEEITCIISGEGPAGPVRSTQARRKPDDQQPRLIIAEGRHR